MKCINCETKIKENNKYCSHECQMTFQRNGLIKLWLEGKKDGMKGKCGTARWIKWYMIDKHGEKCMECDWGVRNEHTGNIPIELEHIDGDFTNNIVGNLKLLCPNCHSLTPTYKNANKKKGRPRSKYN